MRVDAGHAPVQLLVKHFGVNILHLVAQLPQPPPICMDRFGPLVCHNGQACFFAPAPRWNVGDDDMEFYRQPRHRKEQARITERQLPRSFLPKQPAAMSEKATRMSKYRVHQQNVTLPHFHFEKSISKQGRVLMVTLSSNEEHMVGLLQIKFQR